VGLGFLLPDERGQLTISIAAPGSVVDDKRLTELATTIRAAIAEVKPVVEPVT
jgi:DNA-binding IclR family transcriptional regulator